MVVAPRRRANLPADVSSFVGRRKELTQVRDLLSSYRLVTLTGVGGVGKTRLALRTAAGLTRAFGDGVWLVDFSAVSGPGLLAPTIAAALGLRDGAPGWRAERLADHLADKQILLLLDNCEHVIDECAPLVDTLLRGCPGLRVLATSRQVLGLAGECTMRVPSLSVPDAERPVPPPEALLGYEAVSLLAERAAAVLPGFEVGPGNHEAVARLAQRLDGIPLAIELAAVRLRALSVDQVLDHLEDRYRLLTSGSRAALPRQQTLRALIDWSHDLLSPPERRLWARMSVFSGSFELDAVAGICGDEELPAHSVVELAAELVDKSVLIREHHGPRVRYRLLETIREYGRDRLRESGDEPGLRRRHLDWYRELVVRAEAAAFGPGHVESFTRFRAEHANLRVALDYCLTEPGAAVDGLRIGTALYTYWLVGGAMDEGRRWLRRLLDVDGAPDELRARAMAVAGRLAVVQGETAGVAALLAGARALAPDDVALVAHVDHSEGLAEMFHGEPARAVELIGRALAAYRGTGDRFGTALALVQLATSWSLHGDTDRAMALCQESLDLSTAHGERWCAAFALWAQGVIVWFRGGLPAIDLPPEEVRRVRDLQIESIRQRAPFGDSWGVALSLELLAWVACAEGRPGQAARLFGALRSTWRSIGAALPAPLAGEHDRWMTRVRATLGDRAFDAAFQKGGLLTLDEAVGEALGEGPAAAAAPATRLTRRETEIAELVATGLTNKEIAAKLVIAQRTAEGHVENILAKLAFTSRAQIAAWVAERRGS